jgi:hypothetical protein
VHRPVQIRLHLQRDSPARSRFAGNRPQSSGRCAKHQAGMVTMPTRKVGEIVHPPLCVVCRLRPAEHHRRLRLAISGLLHRKQGHQHGARRRQEKSQRVISVTCARARVCLCACVSARVSLPAREGAITIRGRTRPQVCEEVRSRSPEAPSAALRRNQRNRNTHHATRIGDQLAAMWHEVAGMWTKESMCVFVIQQG